MMIRFGAALLVLWVSTFSVPASASPTDGLLDPCTPGTVTGAENELFKDMPPASLGYDEAKLLYNAGITSGCQASPLLFCPSCEISRAQIVTFIVLAAKLPLVNPPTPTFADVPASSPYYKPIETAYAKGITAGCGGGNFCPNAPVQRGAAAVLVAKGAGIAPIVPSTPTFTDVAPTNPVYPFVEALKASCVVGGCSATEYCPQIEMPRAQAAVFIARAFNLGNINSCLSTADAGVDASKDAASDSSSTGGAGGNGGGGGGSGGNTNGGSGGSATGGSGGSATGGSGGVWSDGGLPPSGGKSSVDAGKGDTSGDDGGCGCRSTPMGSWLGAIGMLALGCLLIVVRRRSDSARGA